MSNFEIVNEVIPKTLSLISEDVKQKVDEHKIFYKWRELVGEDADKIFPVKIDGTTLTLYSNSPSLKDKFKYRVPQLISKINSLLGDNVVTKIIFGKNILGNREGGRVKRGVDEVEEIILTDEEISDCKKKSAVIQNPERRKMLFDCLVAKKKADKAKIFSGWHKCTLCENFCPPKEILCNVCQVHERNKMFQAVRKIFYAAPYTKFRDVQKKISELMPHMRSKCTLNFIESARMALIQQTARRLSINDKESPLTKFFVMLVRQLPAESLTEKIIEKTLHEFRFDFVDRPPFKPQNFKKLSARSVTRLN